MNLRFTNFLSCFFIFYLFTACFTPNILSNDGKTNKLYSSFSSEAPNVIFPLSGLLESFEGTTFPPSGWVKVNVANGSTGWERHLLGESPVPGFNWGYITVPPGGGNAVAFCNYITGGTTTNDQWLITPQLTNIQPTDSLIFWMRKFGPYLDHMDIKISTTNPTPSSMTTTISLLTFQPIDSGWIRYKYRIGGLVTLGANIYIGFRQWVTNATNQGASFSLDLVQITTPVGIRNINFDIPGSYKLSQNYPNPFNPSTVINYQLPLSGNVTLIVYDILGCEIEKLVNEYERAGNYSVNFDAANLPSGTYFYKLKSGEFTNVKKMLLIR